MLSFLGLNNDDHQSLSLLLGLLSQFRTLVFMDVQLNDIFRESLSRLVASHALLADPARVWPRLHVLYAFDRLELDQSSLTDVMSKDPVILLLSLPLLFTLAMF